jgi:hypothetical protein
LRDVTVGRDFGTSLEIISGLKPADTIIVNPPDSLSDGARVSLQQTSGAAAPPALAPNTSGKPN